jgi:predicted O-methyltransferase YrrM
MSLTTYLNSKGFYIFEGYSQQIPQQVEELIKYTSKPDIKVLEIGFGAGHSADIFLDNNPTLTLVSFDLGEHPYVSVAKEYINEKYPGRHHLIIGDSSTTIPKYINDFPHDKFDFIFIDGCHQYNISKSDMISSLKLAHKDSIIMLDDTIFSPELVQSWNIGPTRVCIEFINNDSISLISSKDITHGRGFSILKLH